MAQTTIDQFFKVISNNSKKNNVKESSGTRSPIIGKMVSYNSSYYLTNVVTIRIYY